MILKLSVLDIYLVCVWKMVVLQCVVKFGFAICDICRVYFTDAKNRHLCSSVSSFKNCPFSFSYLFSMFMCPLQMLHLQIEIRVSKFICFRKNSVQVCYFFSVVFTSTIFRGVHIHRPLNSLPLVVSSLMQLSCLYWSAPDTLRLYISSVCLLQ